MRSAQTNRFTSMSRVTPEAVRKVTMYIQIVSLVAQAIKALFERSEEHTIIAHYSGCRWCDSTERELNMNLMGGRSWFGNRLEARND